VSADGGLGQVVPSFLTNLFALHGRVRPSNNSWAWELEASPLDEGTWSAATLLPRLEAITAHGAVGEQQRLFRGVERFARERGLGDVIHGWEPDVDWLHGADRGA
jgi:hypothetical protein